MKKRYKKEKFKKYNVIKKEEEKITKLTSCIIYTKKLARICFISNTQLIIKG
jgi:hypothetical protein